LNQTPAGVVIVHYAFFLFMNSGLLKFFHSIRLKQIIFRLLIPISLIRLFVNDSLSDGVTSLFGGHTIRRD
jgi:hypothetical protein